MENSPRHNSDDAPISPNSITTPTRPVRSPNQYQTTYIYTDVSSFKQVVQMLTGFSKKPSYRNRTDHHQAEPRSSFSYHSIPPIKAVPNKKHSSSFRLYERRMKHVLKINPTHSVLPEILSPSILDFPSLALSPVTPLTPDPFRGARSSSQSPGSDEEERAIKEKGFYFHPSPRDSVPRLLPLFPVTSTLSSPSPHEL
ncbi:hypothetical protein CARUB_v10025526mg [Capsella rubella]|uniref:VQ domain-containing protein n=1 Tax=Capsella rubella TaxID=81985 RepID=R0G1H2_9BRAS|nr:VQ motif-containing protein 13 [Capsella rubella]EOA29252.1 hypothetical protein CARUB_v10025526mg [Capsella rubella]